MFITSAALLLACAFCLDDNAADPTISAAPAPRVIAVHDDDTDRGERACWALLDETHADFCAVLPALPESHGELTFTVYTNDLAVAHYALAQVDRAQHGAAIGIIDTEENAPAPPYIQVVPGGKFQAV